MRPRADVSAGISTRDVSADLIGSAESLRETSCSCQAMSVIGPNPLDAVRLWLYFLQSDGARARDIVRPLSYCAQPSALVGVHTLPPPPAS